MSASPCCSTTTRHDDASDDYKELMRQLSEFRENLKEHTYVENDIIFPKAIEMEAVRFDGQNL